MRKVVLSSLLALTFFVSKPSDAQRMRDEQEYFRKLEQFIKESETAGSINEKMTMQEAKIEELRLKIEDIGLIQTKKRIDILIEKYPNSKEKLSELKIIAEKSFRLRREISLLQKQGKQKLNFLKLTPQESQEIANVLSGTAMDRFFRFQDIIVPLNEDDLVRRKQRQGRENPKEAERNKGRNREQEDYLNKIKDENPEMYILLIEQQKAIEQMNQLRKELVDAFQEYQRAQTGKQ